jgi:hypothetical protein
MYLVKIDPSTRVNDEFLDGRLPYVMPEQDLRHPLLMETQGHPNYVFIDVDFYRHVALDLVSETVFDYPYPFVSEKTLRPIFNKRMFIMVGPPGMLQLLKSHGFETWSDIIDETYDTVQEPNTRLEMLLQEARKFCQRDLEEIKHYMQHNRWKFDHNFQVFRDLHAHEMSRLTQLIER